MTVLKESLRGKQLLYELDKAHDEGWLNRNYHPSYPLVIYCYNALCMYKQHWTRITKVARGIVLDKNTGDIVCKPFDKFFNFGETRCNPPKHGDYKSFDKIDGCFPAETLISLVDGTNKTIKQIVQDKKEVTVWGFDNRLRKIIPTKVIGFHNHGKKSKDQWMYLKVQALEQDQSIANHSSKTTLELTINHEIVLNGEFKPAIKAKIGDFMTTFETGLPSELEYFINCHLLGDGSVCTTQNSYKFYTAHKKEQSKNYSDYISKCLGEYFGQQDIRVSGYGTELLRVYSKTFKSLRKIYKNWYREKGGKKVVPEDLSWIDDYAIATWFMDDGSLLHNKTQKDRATFSTDGFTKTDSERLCKKLTELYGVSAKLQKSKKSFFIRINSSNKRTGNQCTKDQDSLIDEFWKRISPYIHPEYKYKLPQNYRSTLYIEKVFNIKETLVPLRSLIVETGSGLSYHSERNTTVAYDLTTETGNYFAKGLLVHNSMMPWFYYDNKWLSTTKASFDNPYVEFGGKYRHLLDNMPKDHTVITEVVMPETEDEMRRAVTHEPGLYLIGLTDMKDLSDKPIDMFYGQWQGFFPKMYKNSVDELVKEANEITGTEGWVVRYSNGYRMKLKTLWYLRVFRALSKLDNHTKAEMLAGKNIDEILYSLPEEFHKDIRSYYEAVQEWIEKKHSELSTEYETILIDTYKMPSDTTVKARRKAFAELVKDNKNKSFLFQLYDDRNIYQDLLEKAIKEGMD